MNPQSIHALKVAAIVVAGLLTGSEFAVAVFFHPCISRLEDKVHIQAAQPLAKVLGMVMSFWYPLTFLLALAVTFVAHTKQGAPWWLALASTVLYALISVYSLVLPVPINNQVARWRPDTVPANWKDLRRRWDLLHAIRVVFLVIALILLVASCCLLNQSPDHAAASLRASSEGGLRNGKRQITKKRVHSNADKLCLTKSTAMLRSLAKGDVRFCESKAAADTNVFFATFFDILIWLMVDGRWLMD